ncbi:MAG: NAD(P)/FAD-dependent oxidoreductase [Acidimicrobiales bacterium]|jgi:pyruvate/2-oxoglutarate dehydrogenase complex dihydrolipoamide dehydrogenase (E3) component
MVERADVIVLGMGPGGEHVAGRLAEEGLDVVGIEGRLLGGECPYWGCVPSKMMLRAAGLLADARRVPGIAGSTTVSADWSQVARRIRTEATDDWDDRVAVERFESKGGRFVRGYGRLTGPGRISVGERELEATRGIVINTGTHPWAPPIPGLAETAYWTNREAIEATEVPSSLVVLGGGAIGVELGQVFARFGSDVSIVEVGPHLLPLEEPEAGRLLTEVLGSEGMRILTGAEVSSVHDSGAGIALELATGESLRAERLLVATGRRVDLEAIGVGAVGLDEKGRSIPVDDRCRAAPGLWAIGDITGEGAFTHVSMYQAEIVLADILGRPGAPADYRALPRVTFTDPEIGSVGLSETQARSAGLDVRTGYTDLPSSARGWIQKVDNAGFIKLVEDADRGVLVGATSAGPCGGEVLSMLTLAVHASVPTPVLSTMIYAYPTFHRAVEVAVKDLSS